MKVPERGGCGQAPAVTWASPSERRCCWGQSPRGPGPQATQQELGRSREGVWGPALGARPGVRGSAFSGAEVAVAAGDVAPGRGSWRPRSSCGCRFPGPGASAGPTTASSSRRGRPAPGPRRRGGAPWLHGLALEGTHHHSPVLGSSSLSPACPLGGGHGLTSGRRRGRDLWTREATSAAVLTRVGGSAQKWGDQGSGGGGRLRQERPRGQGGVGGRGRTAPFRCFSRLSDRPGPARRQRCSAGSLGGRHAHPRSPVRRL